MKRLLTAGVLIPVTLYAVFAGPFWFFFAVVAVISVLCFLEYSQILGMSLVSRALGLIAGVTLLAVPSESVLLPLVLGALLTLTIFMFALHLWAKLGDAGALLLGVWYIFGAMKTAFLLHDRGPYWLCFPLLINWIGDSGAYYFGKRFGRHKLAPRISPGKSWEGTCASIVFSVLFTVLVLPHWIPGMTWTVAIILGIVGNIAGQIGDLAESGLKRAVGVKDSGTLLPGHGGMLDRVDSALFTLPVTYGLLLWLRF